MKHSVVITVSGAQLKRGAASLIVVLLLFLVLSLTAAYTSRNLIFEQKTSANQARSTTAFEAAEAGVEWALTQLNGGRVSDACVESTAPGALSFQERYLAIAANGYISQTQRAPGNPLPQLWPTCVFNGNSWTCACPTNADINPIPLPVGAGSFPAFRIWPAVKEPVLPTDSPWTVALSPRPGLMALTVAGCTRLPSAVSETCLDYLSRGEIGEGLSGVRVRLALRSGLSTPPAAAITARINVAPFAPSGSDPKLYVINTDTRSKGFTVNTANPPGDPLDVSRFVAETIPGSPSEFSFVPNDPKLLKISDVAPAGSSTYGPELTGGDRMFVMTFGMKRQTYREQPGLRMCPSPVVCPAITDINTALANNPNRIIWVEGNLALTANLGTPVAPVLLIVDGERLTLGADVNIYGFVYITGGATDTATIELPNTPTSITGALVAEGKLVTTYSGTPANASKLTVTYNAAALDLMRTTYGSWVRMPGSWRDFKDSTAP